jgi:hypothetical protein
MVREIAVDEDPAPAAYLVQADSGSIGLNGPSSFIYLYPWLRNEATAALTSTRTSCQRPVRRRQIGRPRSDGDESLAEALP